MGKPTELLQGTLDLLVLKTLALEPMHGWGITLRIQQITGDVLQVRPGALYPALHRLEHQGWITAKWGETAAGRRAKYYSLTRAGRLQLEPRIRSVAPALVGGHGTTRYRLIDHGPSASTIACSSRFVRSCAEGPSSRSSTRSCSFISTRCRNWRCRVEMTCRMHAGELDAIWGASIP